MRMRQTKEARVRAQGMVMPVRIGQSGLDGLVGFGMAAHTLCVLLCPWLLRCAVGG